jgi:hypothetical protein
MNEMTTEFEETEMRAVENYRTLLSNSLKELRETIKLLVVMAVAPTGT